MDPSQMEEKGGLPLNFNRLLMKVNDAFPSEEHMGMSSEIIRVVDETLMKDVMTPEGDGSKAFNKSLSEFLKACAERSNSTRKALKLKEEPRSGDTDILENVANNISSITYRQLQVFMETCISSYHHKVVDVGTPIGAIGAHSIGEPGTQMTLKTFHFAGVASQVSKSIKIVMASRSTPLDVDEHNIHVLDARKLEVIPTCDRSKLHFQLHRLKDTLPTVVVRGINSIKRAIIKDCDGKRGTYELAVEGTSLDAVMGINGVDGPNTTSNHIMEVEKTLGIEAARKSIILEIQKTMKDMRLDLRQREEIGVTERESGGSGGV
ncbi:hypothetical protein POM88_004849 [Heracleum sosnowskyi]|uniref:DNA-directed RNA polymerase n=1 Tax=Heracleum sosnowskyi TaxID=360622 RepID=A0AAD8NCX5_9APIA|nr:hypothetical protein POM88_004849 [Heracleum sosnowskyi]